MGAPRGMWPAVWPPNPTVTLADVWAAELATHRMAQRRQANQRKNARLRQANAELRKQANPHRYSNLSDAGEAGNA